jgi:hypothetical protein
MPIDLFRLHEVDATSTIDCRSSSFANLELKEKMSRGWPRIMSTFSATDSTYAACQPWFQFAAKCGTGAPVRMNLFRRGLGNGDVCPVLKECPHDP